jgi:hypothetical protein
VQLDRNRIAIRERGNLEILDLSLRVIRAHAAPLAAALALGAAPAMLLNAWLTAGMANPGPDSGPPYSYFFLVFALTVWEAPLVTAPATLFLGQSMFSDRAPAGALGRRFIASLPQLLLYQVLRRGLMLALVVGSIFVFVNNAYLSEVILLERNPLRRGHAGRPTAGRLTTGRRAAALHAGAFGDLLAQWIIALLVGVCLFFSVWLSLWFAAGALAGEWGWEGIVFTLYYPLALWIVVGFFAVARFLGYLDLRLRREGWEVELMMRAEAARLERQLA